jgi:tRNA modification GTPase
MYNYLDLQDTIVAIATAPGIGAIAVIRLSGKEAITIANQYFNKNLAKVDSHTVHLGYVLDEKDRRIDQVLATVFKNPHSYTREDVVEISCHGSSFIQQQLMELYLRNGARLAKQGEFTLRAFMNGQLDLAQAEAVADLISADSDAAHALAMNQMRGGFSAEIKGLREELIHFASLIELELDFGEEDVEFADRKDLRDLVTRILGIMRQLLDSFHLGNVMKNGVSTVIAGRPNAGKSTLLNTLLNEERAIVSEIAGTTRDTIEELLNINGILYRLVDTAGIREAGDQIEAIGVQKTFEKIAQSTILVYMYDAINTTAADVEGDLAQLR